MQSTVKQAFIDAVNNRGVSKKSELFPDAKVQSGGWTKGQLSQINKWFNEWETIKSPDGSKSIIDMTVKEFSEKNNIKYLVETIAGDPDSFSGATAFETVADQAIGTHSGAAIRPFISYFKTPPGKKLKKKLQVGTQRAQPRLDLPNDFYYTMKTIEDSFENPLDKLTAQFMNMSGHRKEETSRLMIENFLPKKGIVAGSSSYGTKYNLHASEWVIKQGPLQTVHFSPLTKIVIYNALLQAEQQGRTSGPLFPNANQVDDLITDGLIDVYGEKSIAAYGASGVKEKNPSRALLRKAFKGRILSVVDLPGYGFQKDTANLIQGLDMISVEGGYVPVNTVEPNVNRMGQALDDKYIAYSGHGHVDAFIGNNELVVPEKLYKKLNQIPNADFLKIEEGYLDWMPEKAQQTYLGGTKRVDPVDSVKVDFTSIQENIKRNRDATKQKKRLDDAADIEKKKKILLEQLKANNPDANEIDLKRQVDSTLTGTVVKKKKLDELKNFVDDEFSTETKKFLKDKNVDASTPEGAEDLIDKLFGEADDLYQKFMTGAEKAFEYNPTGTEAGSLAGQMDILSDPNTYKKLGSAAIGLAGAGRRLATKAGRTILPQSLLEGKSDVASEFGGPVEEDLANKLKLEKRFRQEGEFAMPEEDKKGDINYMVEQEAGVPQDQKSKQDVLQEELGFLN